jgi:DNA-binding GntR family transcriptional regulator
MPLYMGLARRLHEGLQRGHWQGGRALPSERVLAEALAVSRDTVRKALGLLCQRGVLLRVPGSGTYRAAATSAPGGCLLQRIEAVAATALQAAQLGVAPGTALLHVQRLRYAPGGQPLEIENSYRLGADAVEAIELRLAGLALAP